LVSDVDVFLIVLVSDDNSSLQSSPWQRDHCWKQATPRQNINKELEFQLMRPNCMRKLRYTSQSVHAKRRKPSEPIQVDHNCLVSHYVEF
jgi:hairless-like protein